MEHGPESAKPTSNLESEGDERAVSTGLNEPSTEVAGGPLFSGREPARRGRAVFLRLMIPLACLAALLLALGLIYHHSLQIREEAAKGPTKTTSPGTPGDTDFDKLKPQYVEMVTTNIGKLDRFNGAKYRGSLEALESETNVFQAWAALINEMSHYQLTDSEAETVRSAARKLVAIQTRELPLMRQEWARSLGRTLSRSRFYASSSGRRDEIIRAVLPPGASQDSTDECFGYLSGELPAHLRVARVDFTFSGDITLTTAVKPKNPPPPDSEIVLWRGVSYDIVDWKK